MEKQKLILHDNIIKIVESGQQDLFRYDFAFSIFDVDGRGWVDIEQTIPKVADVFGVQCRTVRRKLYKLVEHGWGTIGKGRYHYKSQEKLATLLDSEYRTDLCVRLSLSDVDTLPKTRAILEQPVLELGRKGEITVARQTRRDKILGSSRNTQLKYEKLIGVEAEANYAILGEYNVDDYPDHVWENGANVFVIRHHKKAYYARQLPNTYSNTERICKPKYVGRGRKGFEKTAKPNIADKLYYEDSKDWKGTGVAFIKQNSGVKLKGEHYNVYRRECVSCVS